MVNTERLEKIISDSGLKKKFIASKVGISPWCLTQKIRNNTEFLASEINILCRILCISKKQKEEIFFS